MDLLKPCIACGQPLSNRATSCEHCEANQEPADLASDPIVLAPQHDNRVFRDRLMESLNLAGCLLPLGLGYLLYLATGSVSISVVITVLVFIALASVM